MIAFFLATLLLWVPPPQTSPKNGTIEGTVTHFGTGDPIPDVEIVMNGEGRSTRGLAPQAISNSRGHFVITEVPPGSYTIQAQRMGYANPAPNGVRVLEGGTTRTVTVAAGERAENSDLAMVNAGTIFGRVLDSAGKPIVSLYVWAYPTDGSGSAHGMTDDHGDYHIVGIPPGKYDLETFTEQTTLYFPGVSDKTKAIVLEIAEGTVLAGLDMTVDRGVKPPSESDKAFKISGRTLDQDGSPLNVFFPVLDLLPHEPVEAEKISFYNEGGSNGAGVFYFTGVRPGHYDIILFNSSNSPFDLSRREVIGRVDVTVADQDVKDIVLTPGGVNVIGQFMTPGSVPTPPLSVRLKMPSNAIQSREMKSTVSEEFAIPNVVSGIWKVVVSDLPANLALLDVRQGDISVYNSGFSVEDRTPAPVQVILGAAGTISGIVRDEQKVPVGAAQVFVISDFPDPAHPATLFQKATTDGSGRFTLSNVATGSYHVFAFEGSAFSSATIPDNAEAFENFLLPEWKTKGTAAVVSGSKLELSLTPIQK